MKQIASTHGSSRMLLVHAGGLGVGLALALGLYAGLVQPSIAASQEAEQFRTQIADQTKQVELITQRINSRKQDIEALTESLKSAVRLEEPSQLNKYVRRIVELAEQSRCGVSEAKPGEYQAVCADYGRVPLDLKCEGKPEDIIGFVQALHDAHRDTDIVTCSLNTTSNGSRTRSTGTLSLHWYTLPEGVPGAASSGTAGDDHNDSAGGKD